MKLKTFIIILFSTVILASCYTSEDQKRLQSECKTLQIQKSNLQSSIEMQTKHLSDIRQQVNDLNKEKSTLQSGKEPIYIVKFKIKQGTFTLDIFEHVKNEMNSIEIEIPVNKAFYNRLSVGQDITDSFKWGSLVMDGDFSTLHMKVIGKRIEY